MALILLWHHSNYVGPNSHPFNLLLEQTEVWLQYYGTIQIGPSNRREFELRVPAHQWRSESAEYHAQLEDRGGCFEVGYGEPSQVIVLGILPAEAKREFMCFLVLTAFEYMGMAVGRWDIVCLDLGI